MITINRAWPITLTPEHSITVIASILYSKYIWTIIIRVVLWLWEAQHPKEFNQFWHFWQREAICSFLGRKLYQSYACNRAQNRSIPGNCQRNRRDIALVSLHLQRGVSFCLMAFSSWTSNPVNIVSFSYVSILVFTSATVLRVYTPAF